MDCGFLKSKKALVTGSSGFIGSHMTSRLVKEGCEVYVMLRDSSDVWRLDDLRDSINFIKLDIRDKDEMGCRMQKIKPDYIFHMAAYGVDSRQKNYTEAIEINIAGTLNLLTAAASTGCEKFLNAGTSMQYGNKSKAIKEDEHYEPANIYGSTKGAATIIAHQTAYEYGINIATIIPFGVFGEKEGSYKFFPHVILSSLKDAEIRLSLCEQSRDYCYVENIIDGFILAAGSGKVKNEIFNIGCGKMHQLKYYAELIARKLGTVKKVKYGALEYRKNDLWNPKPDLTKISTVLGWKPRIGLEEGIDRTIEWFRGNYEKYSAKGR